MRTGRISHWPATPDCGRINETWDREFLDKFPHNRRWQLSTRSTDAAWISSSTRPGRVPSRPSPSLRRFVTRSSPAHRKAAGVPRLGTSCWWTWNFATLSGGRRSPNILSSRFAAALGGLPSPGAPPSASPAPPSWRRGRPSTQSPMRPAFCSPWIEPLPM